MTHWKRQRPVAKAARIKEGHGGTVGNSTMQYACNPFSLKFFYEYVPFIYNWVSYHAAAVALGRVAAPALAALPVRAMHGARAPWLGALGATLRRGPRTTDSRGCL